MSEYAPLQLDYHLHELLFIQLLQLFAFHFHSNILPILAHFRFPPP